MKGEVQKESKWGSSMRYAKIGAAAVGGGALLAVTGTPFQLPRSQFLKARSHPVQTCGTQTACGGLICKVHRQMHFEDSKA